MTFGSIPYGLSVNVFPEKSPCMSMAHRQCIDHSIFASNKANLLLRDREIRFQVARTAGEIAHTACRACESDLSADPWQLSLPKQKHDAVHEEL